MRFTKFKPSRYNLLFPYDTERTLLYNTFSGALYCLTKEEEKKFQFFCVKEYQYENPLDKEFFFNLADAGFFVPSDENEFSLVRQRNQNERMTPRILHVTIIPTLWCNFQCIYCIELHRPGSMKTETEEAIFRWVKNSIKQHRRVELHWFGGEPLLRAEAIFTLSKKIRGLCQSEGVKFVNVLTTNGYLLNLIETDFWDKTDLHYFHITLDGPAVYHDKFRPLRNGGATFQVIRDNVVSLIRKSLTANILIRVNYNDKNFHSIPDLFAEFPSDVRHRICFFFKRIYGDKCERGPIKDEFKMLQDFYRLARSLNFRVAIDTFYNPRKAVYCYADRQSSLIFNFDGAVYKCGRCDYSKEEQMGYIKRDGEVEFDPQAVYWWNSLQGINEEKCGDCVYLPLCMGGCAKTRYSNNGTNECRDSFFFLEDVLKTRYKKYQELNSKSQREGVIKMEVIDKPIEVDSEEEESKDLEELKEDEQILPEEIEIPQHKCGCK